MSSKIIGKLEWRLDAVYLILTIYKNDQYLLPEQTIIKKIYLKIWKQFTYIAFFFF